MEMVKAWNGRWHIYEDDLPPQPAIPKKRDLGVYAPCDHTDEFHRRLEAASYPCWKCSVAGKRHKQYPAPQPERPRALTHCGEEVMVRKRSDEQQFLIEDSRKPVRLCDRCKPVFLRRMA